MTSSIKKRESDPAGESFIFNVPLQPLLRYLAVTTGEPLILDPLPHHVDWHLVLREGLRSPLHLNLGIPGLEDPAHPVEENAATLYAALALRAPSLPVILSGELEIAVQHGLIPDHALSGLREEIRGLE